MKKGFNLRLSIASTAFRSSRNVRPCRSYTPYCNVGLCILFKIRRRGGGGGGVMLCLLLQALRFS